MPHLTHPETGERVRASRATADQLIADGWTEITPAADQAPAENEPKPKSEPKGNTPPSGDPKPLDKMKLTELIEHAEKIGVPADQLDTLRKPGASKAKAIEIIEAHAQQ